MISKLTYNQKNYLYQLLIENINYDDIIDKLKYIYLIYQIDRLHKSFDNILEEKYSAKDIIEDINKIFNTYDYYYCGFVDIYYNFKEIIQHKLKRVGFTELNNLIPGIYDMTQFINGESMVFPVYLQYPEHYEKFYNYLGNIYSHSINSLLSDTDCNNTILRISLKELFNLSKINNKEEELKQEIIKNINNQIIYYKLFDNQQIKNNTEFYLLNDITKENLSLICYFKNISYKSLQYILPYCNYHLIINDQKKEINCDDFILPQITNVKEENDKKIINDMYNEIYQFVCDKYNAINNKLEINNKKITMYQRDMELLHMLSMKVDFYCKINYSNIENIIKYENNRYLPSDLLMFASYIRKNF